MKTLSKALVGAISAGAMVAATASPALAAGRDHHDRDGINAGDVIAGALIVGGIAAIVAAADRGGRDERAYNDYRYDRAGYGENDGYGDRYAGGNPRQAIEQCVYAAERNAARYSYGRADVTEIRQVRDTRYGFEVRGRIAVNAIGRGRGWGSDYRNWNGHGPGYDSGWFSCRYERGRIADLNFGGLPRP